MAEAKKYTCCFFGHRKLPETNDLKVQLYLQAEKLIVNEKVHTFLFGSRSEFDKLCHSIVTILKQKYPFIKRICVRAEFPYINNEYRNYLLEKYEDTYYPLKITGAGKAVYIERNCKMIDSSAFCICYYDKNCSTPKSGKSGTAIAYSYAAQKGLRIINIFNQ